MSDASKITLKHKKISDVINTKPVRTSSRKFASSTKSYRQFVPKIQKRNDTIVPFDFERIVKAIHKAMIAGDEGSEKEAELVAHRVVGDAVRIAKKYRNFLPTVEGIQDTVEKELILSDYVATSKAYIIYRERRAKVRERGISVPEKVKELALKSRKYLRNNSLSEFVYYTAYSKWNDAEGRRETWVETVDRYIDFMRENIGEKLTEKEYSDVREAILNQDICPSMRLLWSAGPAARNSNVCAYNCSYVAPTRLRDFGEMMYISMCGTGLGFSAESDNVQQLPQIKRQNGSTGKLKTHIVEDSKEGWADALILALETWFSGKDIDFDYSKLRPAGAKLKIMGGRSSGPEPLVSLMEFTKEKILARQGKRLRNIDVHDIVCKIGEIVVAGGVRRSALISLSDLDDTEIRDAKKGQFYMTEPQRMMANNSAVYTEKPTAEHFLDEWTALVKSKTGERGIFNAAGLEKQLPERRVKSLKKKYNNDLSKALIRVNPCGEIYLQSRQFCNLTSIVIRAGDSVEKLERKMELATLLGTYQATLTNFGYLSSEWKKNCEAERLLGVSLTGYYDNKAIRDEEVLKKLREVGLKANKKYAKKLRIKESKCITCVKPHGNSSQLLDTASGMHPRYSKYYIRRVRVSGTDPVFHMLKDQGVPYHPEVGQTEENATTFVLEFPVESPKGAILKEDIGAKELLEEWKMLKMNFTEHNPSVTIYVGEDEWISVANFLYENWDYVGGLSFLPRADHVYKLAPYEEITKEKYEELSLRVKDVDFSKLVTYEKGDTTKGAKELSCASGTCEI
ncbi:MAG: ATP cone domain-containing protein [Candidatus Pacebacteria bacterium]|jgi:ribonucleoside-diphosphate reductase alpha chain|nr:ATP cone domain-containing protein [Candidatus Paceibacterota bacterium]|tara:strand:+ start:65915 stop:68299 length:2385 start_codon:yes stop_codon:yes gene_type:complete